MAVPAWFDVNVYLANKLAQLQKANPSANWTSASLASALTAAGFLGTDGAYDHFVKFGASENLSPNSLFSPDEYFQAKAAQFYKKAATSVTDLEVSTVKQLIANAGLNAWTHYVRFGSAEGVNPSNSFDESDYLAAKLAALKVADPTNWGTKTVADVSAAFKAAGYSALTHFLTFKGTGTAEVAATATFTVPDAEKVTPTTPTTTGQTFTLTTGADAISGTSGNDTINAYIDAAGTTDTLTAPDIINGGAGTDTINITTDGNGAGALPAATISNVEVWSIREVGGTAGVYDFGTVAGETSVINNKSTDQVTFNNVAAGSTVTVKGDGATTNSNTVFTMAAATDAVILNIDGGVKAGNITRDATGAATITVNSTGAANTIGILDVDTVTAVKGLTVNATTALTGSLASDYAASSILTVTGAAKVDLSGAALSANFSEVNSSAQTAGGLLVQVDQTDTTVDTKFVGGAGDDQLDVGKVVYSSATLTAVGGTGRDTLRMSDQAALTSTTVKYVTGFEILSLYDDNDGAIDTFDASLMGATAIQLAADSAGDGYVITNMSATAAANVKITDTQTVAPVLSVKDAGVVGNLDTLSITIDDLALPTVAKTTITLADLTAAGVETFNFALTDHLTVTAATGLSAMTKTAFTGDGNLSFTTQALALNVNSTIDASALTGTVLINASNATANGISIKGSATKANTITGTNQNDAITGGTGVDTVKNQANAATDADTVDFISDSSADIFEITTVTGKTTITNFDAATAGTAEDLVNVSNDSVDGAEVEITAAGGAASIGNDRTYVIKQAVGTAGALATGGTATLTADDYTASTLTNVAAYLSERFQGDNDTNADEAVLIILNNGTNSYAYAYQDSTTANTTVDAGELILLGVFNGAILGAEDVYQTV